MIYLLDTNVCVMYLNNRSTLINQKIQTIPPKDIAVCSIVKAELFYGAMRSKNPAQTLTRQQEFLKEFISLDFDDKAAEIFGTIRAQLFAQGTPIGAYNLQIAAIAMANNLILVTHNTKEFSRIERLNIEDWETEV